MLSTRGDRSHENSNHARDNIRGSTKLPKIDFPQFRGDGLKARKYFQLHQVSNEHKGGIADMYFKGRQTYCLTASLQTILI